MTPRQRCALDFIKNYIEEHDGVSPSYDEIKDHLGLASKSTVHEIIQNLVAQGLLANHPDRKRSLYVPDPEIARLRRLLQKVREICVIARDSKGISTNVASKMARWIGEGLR